MFKKGTRPLLGDTGVIPVYCLRSYQVFRMSWALTADSVSHISSSIFQDAFVELYSHQRASMFHPWPYLKTVFGLAALGAAGVTIGALFSQK